MKKEDSKITARLRYLKMSPRKVRLQADVIRGLPVLDAEAQLMLSPRRASDPVLKLLKSAIANAKFQKAEVQKLFVQELRVDQGPTQRRWTPRARGSWSPINKRTSHITIILGSSDETKLSKFVIHEKPKKKVKPSKTKKAKNSEKTEKQKEESKEKNEVNPKPSKGKTGSLKRVFQRKAI